MKIDPDELRQVAAELDAVMVGHPQVLDAEQNIKQNITEARDEAIQKYRKVDEHK